jgi:hypothetical protein
VPALELLNVDGATQDGDAEHHDQDECEVYPP